MLKSTELTSGFNGNIELPFERPFELYHNAFSLCSMKVRLCLSELNIHYKSHHIELIETGCYENIRRSFKRINPSGTVPLLVHNGHPIYESHEQIRYAATQAASNATQLIPMGAQSVIEMERWIGRSSLTTDPLSNAHLSAGNAVPGQTLPLFAMMIKSIPYYRICEGFLRHFDKRRPVMFCAMKFMGLDVFEKLSPLKNALEDSRKHMHKHIDALEQHLKTAQGPWILGEQFSLADVSWLVIFERLRQADSLDFFLPPNERHACRTWWQAGIARPSYREAILEHELPAVQRGTESLRRLKNANSAVRELLTPQRVASHQNEATKVERTINSEATR